MPTTPKKSIWAASDEPMLNVPQSERSDDSGEHSELLTTDVPTPPAPADEHTSLEPTLRAGVSSTANPEAPLVSTDTDARAQETTARERAAMQAKKEGRP